MTSTAPALVLGTLSYLLVHPFLALIHELGILATAHLLRLVASLGATATLSGSVPLNPVYTATMFLLLADVQVDGVAVAAPLGSFLHEAWPAVFAASDLVVQGAWVSAVVLPGASAIARGLTSLAADVLLLLIGLQLLRIGLRVPRNNQHSEGCLNARFGLIHLSVVVRRLWSAARFERLWLVVLGMLVQAEVALQKLTDGPIPLADLEATGITYGFSVLFDGPAAERPRLTVLLTALPEPIRHGVLALLLIALIYAIAAAILWVPPRVWRFPASVWRLISRQQPGGWSAWPSSLPKPGAAPLGLALFALLVAASPLNALGEAESHYLSASAEPDLLLEPLPLDISPPDAAPPPLLSQPVPEAADHEALVTAVSPAPTVDQRSAETEAVAHGPTRVDVKGANYRYSYEVDGERQTIQGMGYNPTYSRLPLEERAARYDRDFAAMRAAGVNTILGWETHEFDGLLLDKAQEHNLGVILPYHIDPELDYTRQAIRDAVRQDVLDWVARYKDHPALRMWGPGNEVLHKLVYPSWMKLRGDPVNEARADAFAAFYVELIDEIHRADPYHPVTYRDAEDAYLARLRDALNRTRVHRPWFVYGINIYTPRLADVIAAWPQMGLDAALLISEFGPGGAAPDDRPHGYREMWAMVRSRPDQVIGGAPYVWLTQGPEEVDRIFGLVNADGRPVDGSLSAIGRLYRSSE